MKTAYIHKEFKKSSWAIIDSANIIIQEYMDAGYELTLRQLYYQFVSRDLIANKQSEYKRLGSIINDARLAGHIDWEAIVDRTRNFQINSHWSSPEAIIRSAAHSYRIDTRADQTDYVEVWVEKDALIGVVEKVCVDLDCGYFSCRGYVSQSEMWAAAQRLRREEEYANTYIIHLGDHDPSGIQMTEDIQQRLDMFNGRTTLSNASP